MSVLKTFFFISILFFISIQLRGQTDGKYDNTWLLGKSDFEQTTSFTGINVISFDKSIIVNRSHLDIPINFNETSLTMSDREGNLIFYSNGISIMNQDHEMMKNGDRLNTPSAYTAQKKDDGYILNQGLLSVPYPGSRDSFILIHGRKDYGVFGANVAGVNSLLYSVIDMSKEDGKGEVVLKNKRFINDDLEFGKLTATRHANGRDWWMIVPAYDSNLYYQVLIDPQGPRIMKEIIAGEVFRSGIGQAFFSPDGTKLARFSAHTVGVDGILSIFDFDRCTGELSNFIRINIPDPPVTSSLAFSPSGQYLYIGYQFYIFQYDTWASDVAATRDTVAIYDGFRDARNNPTLFYLMQLAPDGKIYISTMNNSYHLHTIDAPDEKDCQVNQHSVTLPRFNYYTVPNYPNYRLGALEGSSCDTLRQSVAVQEINTNPISILPNPASDYFSIEGLELKDGLSYDLSIISIDGKLIKSVPISSGNNQINTSDLTNGMYLINVHTDKRFISTQKLVIQR